VITVTLTMYDAVDVSALPPGADAYAGYLGGAFPTFAELRRRFHGNGTHLLSVAVFASQTADCLDIEAGDATNAEAPGWVKRQLARGAGRPCLYTSGVQFHGHAGTTLDLSWAAGSHRLAVPPGISAALVERVDAGPGDVSLVCE
jgi:hypothetical protein